jgi:ribonuclease D
MRITVADSPKHVDEWVQQHIIDCSVKILGLDVEWKPVYGGYRISKAALLQIAAEDEVLLVRLFHLQPNGVPPLLTKVLGDEKIRKAGVGVEEDGAKLLTDWGVRVEGIVDISEQLQTLEGEENYLSLAKVTLRLIGVDMCKDHKVTMSNWELKVLSRDQILYAAIDAWVGR